MRAWTGAREVANSAGAGRYRKKCNLRGGGNIPSEQPMAADDPDADAVRRVLAGETDAFVAAFRALHTFRGDAAFSTWLTAVALNSRARLRRDGPPPAPLDVAHLLSAERPPDERLSAQREAEAVRHAFATLSARCRPSRSRGNASRSALRVRSSPPYSSPCGCCSSPPRLRRPPRRPPR